VVAVLSLMTARWVGQNSGPIFLPFLDQSTPSEVCLCGSVRSLQRCFLIDDVLLHSRDIRDQVTKLCKITRKYGCFCAAEFREDEATTQISDRILQIWVTIEHVAKFGDDWRLGGKKSYLKNSSKTTVDPPSYSWQAAIKRTRKSCTERSPVRSIGHARSGRRRVAMRWKEQKRRSQNCKYLP